MIFFCNDYGCHAIALVRRMGPGPIALLVTVSEIIFAPDRLSKVRMLIPTTASIPERVVTLDLRSEFDTIKRPEVVAMNISTDIKSVTYLKSKTADLLKQVNESRRPVVITQNGEPRGVLQDPKSYENMRNAIGILKLLSQGEEDIKNGRSKSQKSVFENIEKSLTDK